MALSRIENEILNYKNNLEKHLNKNEVKKNKTENLF